MEEKVKVVTTTESSKSDGNDTREAEKTQAKEVAAVSKPSSQDYGVVPSIPEGMIISDAFTNKYFILTNPKNFLNR